MAVKVRSSLRALRPLSGEGGYSVTELLTVLAILSTVVGGLTTVFVSASNAQVELNRRIQAQIQARLALDRLRREAHCATSASAASSSSVTLTMPAACRGGAASVTWCARSEGGASRFGLYRVAGTSCSGGIKVADYLDLNSDADADPEVAVFAYTAPTALSLARLRVNFPVDLKPQDGVGAYRLEDEFVLRNSRRA